MSRRFRSLYGAGPLNLMMLIVSFAIAGAAVAGWFQRPRDVTTILEWFAAAIVLHDLVVVPLYSLLDRIVFRRQRRHAARSVVSVVGSTPYLRIPAILSGLLFAVFFPVIFGLGAQAELNASGIAESGYLARWLIASGAMFAVSGMAYGVAAWRSRGRHAGAAAPSGAARGAAAAKAPAGAPGAAVAPATAKAPAAALAPGVANAPAAPAAPAVPDAVVPDADVPSEPPDDTRPSDETALPEPPPA